MGSGLGIRPMIIRGEDLDKQGFGGESQGIPAKYSLIAPPSVIVAFQVSMVLARQLYTHLPSLF